MLALLAFSDLSSFNVIERQSNILLGWQNVKRLLFFIGFNYLGT
jgi:hypothetical protein